MPDTKFRIPLSKVGFPIRKSADQSFFAAPRGLSQRSTSFIASQRQGIHQMPLSHLITLIINAHPSSVRCGNSRRIPTTRYVTADIDRTRICIRADQTLILERPLFLLHKIEPTARRSSFADMIMRDIGRWIVAAVEHVIRSAQNVWPAAATFARNDLLFTMSDNTRMANGPWTGRFAKTRISFRMSRMTHSRTGYFH